MHLIVDLTSMSKLKSARRHYVWKPASQNRGDVELFRWGTKYRRYTDAVSFEYGPTEPTLVLEIFKNLEKICYVELRCTRVMIKE